MAGDHDSTPRHPIPGVTYRSPDVARGFLDRGDWLPQTLGDALRATARAVPGRDAVIGPDGAMSFAALDERSESTAAGLLSLGLQSGDRALFQVGTAAEFLVAFYACAKAGIVPVCTLPQYRESEMRHFAQAAEARAIFVQADVNPRFDQVAFAKALAAEVPSLEHVIVLHGRPEGTVALDDLAAAHAPEAARARTAASAPGPSDVATLQLSGGSTSLPKIIPRFHGEYLAAVRDLSARYGLTGEDVTLWSLPLIHNAGTMYAVLPVALEGRTLVLQPRVDIPEMLSLVERHRVTFSGSIGPIAARMLEVPDIRQGLGTLRQFFSLTSAAAVEEHVGIPVGQMFGMTEGMVFASAPDAPAAMRHGTVGHPISRSDEVRLLGPGTESEVPFGEVGELCFRGPSTLTGYVGDPAATAATFTSDGFVRSGDLMRARRIGDVTCYVFEGRIKDNINRGGEKIGAEEVEGLVGRHPDVADVRVVAMPDPYFGEKACAFIIRQAGRPAPDVADLGRFLTGLGIAKYKVPERVEVVDAFPLTRVGKADKARLRAMIAERLAEEARAAASAA